MMLKWLFFQDTHKWRTINNWMIVNINYKRIMDDNGHI